MKHRIKRSLAQLRIQGPLFLVGFVPIWALAMFIWPEPFELTPIASLDFLLYLALRGVLPIFAGIGIEKLFLRLRAKGS